MDSQSGRIVAGYDGSDAAGAALDWAAAEAERRRRPLTVLHVLDYYQLMPGPVGVTSWPDLDPGDRARIAAEGAVRARKHADSIDIAPLTVLGQTTRVLIEASHEADLIVLGTRGHGDLAGTVLGSVAFTVSAHASCPVVIVRGDSSMLPGPHRPVVVGIDDSAGADLALRYAADLAAETGARLIITSAYHPALLQVWTGALMNTIDTGRDADADREARSATERVLNNAILAVRERHPGLDVETRARHGSAAGVITAATHQAGLAVVGSRGRGGFTGLLLGSVSHGVIHTALCPVAVVRA